MQVCASMFVPACVCVGGDPPNSQRLCVPPHRKLDYDIDTDLYHSSLACPFSGIIFGPSWAISTFFHFLISYIFLPLHYLAFSHLCCCSRATFPGMVRAVAVVVAAMSKSFPCSLIGGSLFPLQASGVPTAGLCPTPLTPQWVFMLPRLPSPTSLHHTSLRRGTAIHRGHQGTEMPTLLMPCAVHHSFTVSDTVREVCWIATGWFERFMSGAKCFSSVLFSYSTPKHLTPQAHKPHSPDSHLGE